jgi:hypothetical protein
LSISFSQIRCGGAGKEQGPGWAISAELVGFFFGLTIILSSLGRGVGMQKNPVVLSIKTAMQRRLDDLNLRSIMGDDPVDTSHRRLGLEISLRKIDGIDHVKYWLLELGGRSLLDFRKSLKIWLNEHHQYSFAVKILIDPQTEDVFLEAPLQLEISLDAWLGNYWGMGDVKLKNHLAFNKVASFCRLKVVT